MLPKTGCTWLEHQPSCSGSWCPGAPYFVVRVFWINNPCRPSGWWHKYNEWRRCWGLFIWEVLSHVCMGLEMGLQSRRKFSKQRLFNMLTESQLFVFRRGQSNFLKRLLILPIRTLRLQIREISQWVVHVSCHVCNPSSSPSTIW